MAWTREEREGVLEELWPMVKDGQREMRERLEAALGIIEAHWNESLNTTMTGIGKSVIPPLRSMERVFWLITWISFPGKWHRLSSTTWEPIRICSSLATPCGRPREVRNGKRWRVNECGGRPCLSPK